MTLLAEIREEIATSGPLRFDHYMERALFHPAHGYYASGRARIGKTGDFYTNVSIGPVFGHILSVQFVEIYHRLGAPKSFTLVEQGANDAAFARDVLDNLRKNHPEIYHLTAYHIIEPFPALREAQERHLAAHAGRVAWSATLEETPAFTGVHFTNEYADALPVRIAKKNAEGWSELHVVSGENTQLASTFPPLRDAEILRHLPPDLPEGYLAEFRPAAAAWMRAIAARLERGLILTVDYGFPAHALHAPWRQDGTLSCYAGHQRDADALTSPGEKDITAHVDFTRLAEAGVGAGLALAGFTDQYHFLSGAAEPLLLQDNTSASPATLRALKTLLHPETMGTQFKYLALTRGLDLAQPLAGFRHAPPPEKTLGL